MVSIPTIHDEIRRACRRKRALVPLLRRLGACAERRKFKGVTLDAAWRTARSWQLEWWLRRIWIQRVQAGQLTETERVTHAERLDFLVRVIQRTYKNSRGDKRVADAVRAAYTVDGSPR